MRFYNLRYRHHVVNHECVICDTGSTKPFGDDASGPDTDCNSCSNQDNCIDDGSNCIRYNEENDVGILVEQIKLECDNAQDGYYIDGGVVKECCR